MKKTFASPLMLVSFILLTMLVASCANNSHNTPSMVENPEENQGNQPTELRSVTDQLRSINPDALANWANKYLGHEYVKWYEFATAKWAAPKRFTCTTLVWWCAKKAYGVNVSSWYSPLVTPSGLFTDNCTYIRANVL